MIKAILMDYAGVILQAGQMFDPLNDFCPSLTKEKSRELWKNARVGDISGEEYMLTYPEKAWDWYFEQTVLHKGVKEFIQTNKLPKYIASNHISILIQKQIDMLDVRDYFKEIFVSDELKLAKPDKEFFEEILKRIDLNADEVIFVDDQKRNLFTAQELGMKTIWVNNIKETTFGHNSDMTPDAELYNLSKLNEIISEMIK